MDNQNENSARLWVFQNDYRENSKQPETTGNGEVSVGLLRQLVDAYKQDETQEVVKVKVAGWPRESKAGKSYQFFKIEMPHAESQPATVESTSSPPQDDIAPF